MNKLYINFHLKEMQEALEQMIVNLEQNSAYGQAEFRIDISHLYNHINTAWNARGATDEETLKLTDELFLQMACFSNRY